MLRAFCLIYLFLCSSIVQAKASPLYQIDMIVFAHRDSVQVSADGPLFAPNMQQAIPLQNDSSPLMKPYHTLPSSASQLKNEYWALNKKSQYQVLFHYTWLQPANNQRPVALSQTNTKGWNMEGTFRVRRSNYYLLDTELVFSAPNSPEASFVFAQKQRLKPGIVYYLDHPQAGMLIKIHQIT